MIVALDKTGFPSQYFSPSHILILATFALVTVSGVCETICSIVGGFGPERYTDEKKPERWRASAKCRLYLLLEMDVRPSRALDAFWR